MKSKKISTIIACIMMTTTILNPYASYVSATTTNANATATSNTVNTISENSIYLSNLEYDTDESAAWNYDITKDTNINGGKITLKVDDEVVTFNKGMGAHATSYLVYDISEYSDEYTRLSAYLGVDYSQAGLGNGVKFKIYTSNDKASWNLIKETDAITANGNALYVDLDVANAKYIRMVANTNGNNSNDHSVYGDLRLIKPGYDIKSELFQAVKPLSYYDDILSKETVEDNYKNNLKLVLEREFVNRVGYRNIQNSVKDNQDIKEAVEWLLSDKDALDLFIEAGSLLNGSGTNTLNALGNLYKNYKDVLSDEGDGYVYKKMLIATAVAYCKTIKTYAVEYGGNAVNSDPVKKFEAFKKLYDEGKFLRKEEFKTYNMELVRYVMDAKMDDEEILWLSKYSQFKYPNNVDQRLNIASYIDYIDANYSSADLYSDENKEMWDEKYKLTEYGINSYGDANRYRLWMLMEKGAICWGMSGLGVNLNEIHGIPAVNIYQPGHEAYLVYSQDNNNNGTWKIWNGVGSWADAFSRWGNGVNSEARLLLGWGCKSYNSFNKNNGNYMLLAQGALNKYEDYKKSLYYNLIANSYELGSAEREDAYNKALEALNINLDSYDGLIESYKAAGNKTSQQWADLAKRIINAYTYYPLPMVEALNRITPYINELDLVEINTLKVNALNSAAKATEANSLQPDACKAVANSLLGNKSGNLASFSFNGEYANQIKINEAYENVNLTVKYSLDGGSTWKETQEHAIKLTEQELKSINVDHDIIVGLVGSDTTYTIDINSGKTITTSSVYNNDLENLLVGDVESLEYSLDGGTTWKDYVGGLESETRFTGDKVVKVRYKAHDTYLQGNEVEYTFTEDANTPEESYLQLKNVSLHGYSSQSTDLAVNFIDGNANNSWHTVFGIDNNKFYSVKFDKVRYISKLTYLPVISPSGRLKAGDIYTSMDGTTWEKVHSFSGLANSKDLQTIDLPSSVEAMYLKIVPTETYGITSTQNDRFFSGRMLNFYEDTTKGNKEEAVEESVEEEVDSTENTNNEEVVEESVEVEVDSTEKSIMLAKDLNLNGTQESSIKASENLQSSYNDILNLEKGTFTFKYKLDESKLNSTIVSLMTISDKDAFRSYASFYIKPSTNRIGIEIANRYVANQNVDVYVQNNSKPINNTDLQNISYVFDGTNMTVYLNGELFGTANLSGFLNDVSWKAEADNVTIGANPRTNNGSLQYQWPFSGVMNEVRVQEEVLSAEEVKTLHAM